MTYFVAPSIPSDITKQIRANYEVTGKPLLDPFYPEKVNLVLEAIECGDIFILETVNKGSPPKMSWRAFNEKYVGEDPEFFMKDMGLLLEELDSPADPDIVFDHWLNNPSPSATPSGKVYHLLENLDLGPASVVLDDLELDHLLGHIIFVDGEHPGSNWRGVKISSANAVSALQWKLTQLGKQIKIRL
ncbi:hypothetical protein [Fodinibius sediminis]|nr:hypothetical protein [Fodinibius sediminis]